MTIKARRLIRRKGSPVAVAVGKVREFDNLSSLAKFTRKQHKVFAFMVDNGSQGIMRSGRRMRAVDLHVRNVLDSFLFDFPPEE
jgi:hypothetical protein